MSRGVGFIERNQAVGKQRARREFHGESQTPLWNVWNQMLCRCYSPTHQVRRFYGERGITVCPEWFRYIAFRDWALANGYHPGLTIDRISSDGNYEPGNCQWIPQPENARKCRNTVWWVEAFGETKTIGQWLGDPRVCPGLLESCVRMRLSRGWDAERALTTPRAACGPKRKGGA